MAFLFSNLFLPSTSFGAEKGVSPEEYCAQRDCPSYEMAKSLEIASILEIICNKEDACSNKAPFFENVNLYGEEYEEYVFPDIKNLKILYRFFCSLDNIGCSRYFSLALVRQSPLNANINCVNIFIDNQSTGPLDIPLIGMSIESSISEIFSCFVWSEVERIWAEELAIELKAEGFQRYAYPIKSLKFGCLKETKLFLDIFTIFHNSIFEKLKNVDWEPRESRELQSFKIDMDEILGMYQLTCA